MGSGYRHGYGHDHRLPQESLQIKADGKFFSRVLSKESSGPNSSYRVLYYGGAAGAVPFMWEIQPGTPKHTLSDTSLTPPLTPPPSHHSINPSKSRKSMERLPKTGFLLTVFPRLASRKGLVSPSSPSSWSSMSSTNTSRCTNTVLKSSFHGVCCFSGGQRSGRHFGVDDEDGDHVFRSPTSALQFGDRSKISCRRPWMKAR